MLKKTFNIPFVIALLGLTLCLGNFPIYGQGLAQSTTPQYYWITAGAGGSTIDLAGGGNVSYMRGNNIFSGRFIYNKRYEPLANPPSNDIWDTSLIYGRSIIKTSEVFASIGSGLGLVGGVERGELKQDAQELPPEERHERHYFLNYGIPVEGQLFWTPIKNFGIGIYAFGNYNPEKSFVGGLISIQIGKIHRL